MAFSSEHDVIPVVSHAVKNFANSFDGFLQKSHVVSHRIDVSALRTKVNLHIDHKQACVTRLEVSVVGPMIRVCLNENRIHGLSLLVTLA